MDDIQIHKAKSILTEEVIPYLIENMEAAKDLCGEDDEINYIPACKAYRATEKVLTLLKNEEQHERNDNHHQESYLDALHSGTKPINGDTVSDIKIPL